MEAVLRGMGEAISHRGPDSAGTWFDPECGVGFSHRRLAIVDLSAEGHQPMHSVSGRYVLIYNGEVYNYQELQAELIALGEKFRGHSDTEVLLAAFENWGILETLKRSVGMFAFALWDSQERVLHLARDRMGEKPLYYGCQGETLLFGSELKALQAHPAWRGEINRDALCLLLRNSYIAEPHSIFEGIQKLQPGTLATFSQRSNYREAEITSYWSLQEVAERGEAEPLLLSYDEALDEFERLLRQAIRGQMISDVPLGAFLSGGVDSSTIVSLMQDISPTPVKTFTIGFNEEKYNEAPHAKAVAEHLGTQHFETYVSAQDALDVVPQLPTLFDEPFADPSMIPTYLVSKMTKKEVTVSLSGDAGDELLAGYRRYQETASLWRKLSKAPRPLRRTLASLLGSAPLQALPIWSSLLSSYGAAGSSEESLQKLVEVLRVDTPRGLYRRILGHWKDPASVVLSACEPQTALTDLEFPLKLNTLQHQLMCIDCLTYLPGDILTKVDRAGMAVSLESRIPMLDHRLIEFLWCLPIEQKFRPDRSKRLLRDVLDRYVPKQLIDRPKTGFGIPIHQWLRGPLRDWAESLLDERLLREQGYFAAEQVRSTWQSHCSGEKDLGFYLWDILMFQAWFQQLKKN